MAFGEDVLNDFFLAEFFVLAENGFDDVGDGTFFVAPLSKGVDAAADEDEVWMAN